MTVTRSKKCFITVRTNHETKDVRPSKFQEFPGPLT